MACPLTTGFALDCKNSVGGVKKIWVITSANKGTLTKGASGNVTAWVPVANSMFGYELRKETGSYDPEIATDDKAGTTHYPGQLTFPMAKMDALKRNELKLLAQNDFMTIVKDKNGLYWLNGEDSGCTLMPTKGASGVAMGDFNGWNVVIGWDEPDMPLLLDSAVVTALGLT